MVSVNGNESFIAVCVPRQPGVVTKVLYVLHKYRIRSTSHLTRTATSSPFIPA
jgi:hypothetical protein